MTRFFVKHWFGVTLAAMFAVALGFLATQYKRKLGQLPTANPQTASATTQTNKNRSWNVALGDVVIIAKDLGFTVEAINDAAIDRDRIMSRIETQMQPLRAIYRQAVAEDPSIMGTIILRFDVSKDGEIANVTELSTRLTNEDFRLAVIDEAKKWSLRHFIRSQATIECPLLFVREGMDLTTLVQWEKALSTPDAATASAKAGVDAYAIKRVSANRARLVDQAELQTGIASRKGAQGNENSYRIKYVVPLRTEPNFTSERITTFTIGTRVKVIKRLGDWLEVNSSDGQFSGYIRKEFVS